MRRDRNAGWRHRSERAAGREANLIFVLPPNVYVGPPVGGTFWFQISAQAKTRLSQRYLRLRFRARGANQPHRFPPARPAPRSSRRDAIPHPSAHASPCLWLCAGQCGPRHPQFASLSWTQEHPAHGPVHRNGARPVQGLLEGLTQGISSFVGKLGLRSRLRCARRRK